MQNFFIYLLQVSAWFIPLYLLYLSVFRRFTFFTANRIYLLLTLVLPFVLPLVHVTFIDRQIIEAAAVSQAAPVPVAADIPVAESTAAAAVHTAAGGFNWLLPATVIYAAGFLWVFIPFATGIARVIRSIRGGGIIRQNGLRLVVSEADHVPSSFFNYVFISDNLLQHPQRAVIMAHENAHFQRLHTADLLAAGLVKSLLWFNPFVWLYGRSLREVHEFEADRATAVHHDAAGYARLLLQFAGRHQQAVLHPFSTRPVTTRINMLLTQKTVFMKRFAYLLLLPVILLLFMAFGNIRRSTHYTLPSGSDFVLMIDAGHGGNDPGAVIAGTDIAEKEINLALALQLQQLAEAAGIKVIMTRTADSTVALKDRTELAAREKAGLILSLHAAMAAPGTGNKNGIEFYAGLNTNPAHANASMEVVNYLGSYLKKLDGIAVSPSVIRRDASVWILKQAPCPSVVVECGYLSHAGDRAFLSDEAKRRQLAQALLEGVLAFVKSQKAMPAENGVAEQTRKNNNAGAEFRSGPVTLSGVIKASDKMLVLYMGADNKVALKTADETQNIAVEMDKGIATGTGNGAWTIRANELGPCKLKVYGEKNGRRELLASFSFMVMPLPRPAWQIPGLDYKSRKNNEGC